MKGDKMSILCLIGCHQKLKFAVRKKNTGGWQFVEHCLRCNKNTTGMRGLDNPKTSPWPAGIIIPGAEFYNRARKQKILLVNSDDEIAYELGLNA